MITGVIVFAYVVGQVRHTAEGLLLTQMVWLLTQSMRWCFDNPLVIPEVPRLGKKAFAVTLLTYPLGVPIRWQC